MERGLTLADLRGDLEGAIRGKDRFQHGLSTDEVEEVLFSSSAHYRLVEKGMIEGEHLYVAYGQTYAGRYVVVFFVRKYKTAALPISARKMTDSERRYYDERR